MLLKCKTSIVYLLAFLLPFGILFGVLVTQTIYWNSDRTILASDGFHQYVIFAQNLRNILHGSDSIFYTFTSGLGLNFYSLISYYLGSFLSPFVYFFSLKTMPNAIYLFTLIKFGLSGISMFFTLRMLYKGVNKNLLLSLSTAYSLMSFAVSQLEINTWLDVFIIVPLIILGLHQLLDKRRVLLYYCSLTILFILNYYFGYMCAVFLFFYFFVQITKQFKWKKALRQFFDFAVVSILATLTSFVMLLPTYFDLATHGESLSIPKQLITENSWWLDFFAKTIVGSYDTTKYGSIPMIYVGILPLLLAILFFTLSTIKWQVRLAYFLLVLITTISFYIEPLDLFWQGMHAPNMFLHRYAWLFSLLIVLLAAETLNHLENLTLKKVFCVTTILLLGWLLTFLFHQKYSFLTTTQIILTVIFTLSYLLIVISVNTRDISQKLLMFFVLIFTMLEISTNTYYMISGLSEEWIFPTKKSYQSNLHSIDKLVKKSKKREKVFYRTERLNPQTGNDSMKFNYNGISQFSSVRNRLSSFLLDRLGFQSLGTNLNLRYQNNTLITDSLFAVKYNLSTENPQKFGFDKVDTIDNMSLYRNKYAAQLALMTDKVYKDASLNVNTLDNQQNLLNHITGLSEIYYKRLTSFPLSEVNQLNNKVSLKSNKMGAASITYRLTLPEKQQVYVSVPQLTFDNSNEKEVVISYKHSSLLNTVDDTYSFFNIGYFNKPQVLDVTFTFPHQNSVSFEPPNFYGLDIVSYQKAMTKFQHQRVHTKTHKNKVITTYFSNNKTSLIYTLPYDKGWKATLNHKRIKIRKAQKGLMVVDVPKGTGKVTLHFIPEGFYTGSIISIIAFIIFSTYATVLYFLKKKLSKSE